MTLELLVTGTGRCGTAYIADALTQAGLPCSHEGMFTPNGVVQTDTAAESSWMAVPYLSTVKCPIVLLVRNPMEVVRSLLGIEFFTTPGPYRDFLIRHQWKLAKLEPADAAWEFWTYWNLRALPRAKFVMDINDPVGCVITLASVTNREIVLPDRPVNSRQRVDPREAVQGVDRVRIDRALELYDKMFRS